MYPRHGVHRIEQIEISKKFVTNVTIWKMAVKGLLYILLVINNLFFIIYVPDTC